MTIGGLPPYGAVRAKTDFASENPIAILVAVKGLHNLYLRVASNPEDAAADAPKKFSRQPWPIGLRIAFAIVVLGFLVNTAQIVFYGVMGQGLFADELGGRWMIPSYVLTYVTIMLGGFRLRRLFTFALTGLCLYSIPVVAFQTWPMLQDFWHDLLSGWILAGATPVARLLTWETWCFTWNTICLSLDTGVLLYLLSYEFRLFGPGRAPRYATRS